MAKNNEINLFNIYVLLLDESISGYELEKEVGISRTTLLKVRADKEKFLSLSINTLVKIQEWLNSDAGKAYLSSPANDYNLKVMGDLDLGACAFCKKIDLVEVEEVILNPAIKTQLLKEFAGPVWEYFDSKGEDGPWKSGLMNELELDKLNGFFGKTSIHPVQLPVIAESNIVDEEDYQDAQNIMGMSNGLIGVAKGHGGNKMNEVKTHSHWAKKIIAQANVYGVKATDKGDLF